MWTYNDDANLLPNIIIRSKFKDGILKHYQIYPVDGYVLRIPNMDEYRRDENGEYVGFDLDLAAEVCKRNDWELVKQPIDWNAKDMEQLFM